MKNKLTVGYGTKEEREIEIINGVQAEFIDKRCITVAKLEDDSFFVSVENYKSSGRNVQDSMWLSKESFLAMLSTCAFYLEKEGCDIYKEILEMQKGKEVEFAHFNESEEI